MSGATEPVGIFNHNGGRRSFHACYRRELYGLLGCTGPSAYACLSAVGYHLTILSASFVFTLVQDPLLFLLPTGK